MSITYETIRKNEAIRTYIKAGNDSLGILGYTEHGFAHAGKTADTAAMILKGVGADERTVELSRIAGYMHDIGNMINRDMHAHSGATIAFRILDNLGMPAEEIALICSAIGNHDENTGRAVNAVAAALILADKSDVRRSRVRNRDIELFRKDIHDRVNYAVFESSLDLDTGTKQISLILKIDTEVCPVIDYFEIFLSRMLMCRRAAEFLELRFALLINGTKLM